MAQHEAILSGGRPAVHAVRDLPVGAADAEGDAGHQELPRAGNRVGQLLEACRPRHARRHGEGPHPDPLAEAADVGAQVSALRVRSDRITASRHSPR